MPSVRKIVWERDYSKGVACKITCAGVCVCVQTVHACNEHACMCAGEVLALYPSLMWPDVWQCERLTHSQTLSGTRTAKSLGTSVCACDEIECV